MIECLDQIQISINERLDHLTTLLTDSEHLSTLIKDEEKRRIIVKNFRVIKLSEKHRINNQQKYLKIMDKFYKNMTKNQIMASETMFTNCMNQYLNTDYEARKSGENNDLIDAFIFYYQKINAVAKVNQLKVIKNCNLFNQINFVQQNLSFFLSNVQTSMNYIYQAEKSKFFSMTKLQSRSFSPQKKIEEQQEQKERFDVTGKMKNKEKKKLQSYCYEMSKLLDLQGLYVNYFYFNTLDIQKRKKTLTSNYLKRNVHIKRLISSFQNDCLKYRQKSKK